MLDRINKIKERAPPAAAPEDPEQPQVPQYQPLPAPPVRPQQAPGEQAAAGGMQARVVWVWWRDLERGRERRGWQKQEAEKEKRTSSRDREGGAGNAYSMGGTVWMQGHAKALQGL